MKYRHLNIKKAEAVGLPCRKTAYHTSEEAEDMIKYINETRVTRNIRSYKCNVCGFWHLTSRSD
ncbi:MAG TPA: hypothetical protein VK155_14270 [Bacteroidales bacterium]|jgi:hypothetical protein|nr:hypothetical protein [Bacteroidales bacterium]